MPQRRDAGVRHATTTDWLNQVFQAHLIVDEILPAAMFVSSGSSGEWISSGVRRDQIRKPTNRATWDAWEDLPKTQSYWEFSQSLAQNDVATFD